MIVNAESHFWTVREVLPDMMARNNGKGEGHIVSVASIAGLAGGPVMGDYCASKAAAYVFLESLRVEMKSLKKNIVCTTILPFFINTGMFEGVTLSPLCPMLEQKTVVKRMMNAILQEENGEVSIPWNLGVLCHLLKAIFPSRVCDRVNWFLGGWKAMGTYRGR